MLHGVTVPGVPVTTSTLPERPLEGTSGARHVAVIGAGLAGLVCARTLADHGLRVTVFDKGRAPGGRATSRHADGGRVFDHGAQFFTARGEWLSRQVLVWEDDGVVARWSPRVGLGSERRLREGETWWVGAPRMGALAAHLARPLEVRLGHVVSALARSAGGWSLTVTGGAGEEARIHHADALVVAVPAPQCAALLAPISKLHREVAAVEQTPCWAVMAAVKGAEHVDADLFEDRGGAIAWAAREGSKPGRTLPEGEELWTLHASTEWSKAHLEDSPESVSDALLRTFFDRHRGLAGTVVEARAHRWRYARGRTAGDQPDALFDEAARVAVCGDWLAGERVEGALTSGLAAAALLLGGEARHPHL